MFLELLVDSFQAESDFFPSIFFKQEIWAAILKNNNNKTNKIPEGTHEEVRHVPLWNMDPKQLSDCSLSKSNKYTECRMKENVFH